MPKESPNGSSEGLTLQDHLLEILYKIILDKDGPQDRLFWRRLMFLLDYAETDFNMAEVMEKAHNKAIAVLDQQGPAPDLPLDGQITPELAADILAYRSGVARTLDSVEAAYLEGLVDACNTPEKLKALVVNIRMLAGPNMRLDLGDGCILPVHTILDLLSREVGEI